MLKQLLMVTVALPFLFSPTHAMEENQETQPRTKPIPPPKSKPASPSPSLSSGGSESDHSNEAAGPSVSELRQKLSGSINFGPKPVAKPAAAPTPGKLDPSALQNLNATPDQLGEADPPVSAASSPVDEVVPPAPPAPSPAGAPPPPPPPPPPPAMGLPATSGVKKTWGTVQADGAPQSTPGVTAPKTTTGKPQGGVALPQFNPAEALKGLKKTSPTTDSPPAPATREKPKVAPKPKLGTPAQSLE